MLTLLHLNSKTKMVAQKYQGFDMDLIRAVAKEMGYTSEIQNVNFDGLIPAMESGNIDIIASGMTINEERKNQVEFSDLTILLVLLSLFLKTTLISMVLLT